MTRALRIEDVEGVPWMAGMTWHPVRMELGLHAFGAAGFSGGPGDAVVEPHMVAGEGRGHEELYVVLSGPATFTLDGFEWLMRAKAHMATDPDRAREILHDGLAELPGSAAIPYGFALLEATEGDIESARASLAEAIARDERLREEAEREPLLDAIRP
jgi:hypothetical protein